jgi:putative ABC transport system permease protein
MNFNIATLAWRNIRTRQARSWLTILGILIGVMAIVTLISIGTGVENAVLRQFENVGLDVVLLIPTEAIAFPPSSLADTGEQDTRLGQIGSEDWGSMSTQPVFTGSDVEPLPREDESGFDPTRLQRDVPEVTEVGQIATRVFTLSATRMSGFLRVIAVSRELVDRFSGLLGGFVIARGRGLDAGGGNEVILGARRARETGIDVGGTISIEGIPFVVVGILEPSGESNASVGGGIVSGEGAEAFESLARTDDAAFMLHEQAQALWPDMSMSSIVAIRIRTGVSVIGTLAKINDAVVRQGVFMTPVSTQALADNVQRTLGMVKIVLASIAAISLVVGAVGMMNTMYTSVLERTRVRNAYEVSRSTPGN